jgi:hypothetical protein
MEWLSHHREQRRQVPPDCTRTCQPAPACQLSDREPQCLGQEMSDRDTVSTGGRRGGGIDWPAPAARRGVQGRGAAAARSSSAGRGRSGGSRVPGEPRRDLADDMLLHVPKRGRTGDRGRLRDTLDMLGGVGLSGSPCNHRACPLPIMINSAQNDGSDPFSDRLRNMGPCKAVR